MIVTRSPSLFQRLHNLTVETWEQLGELIDECSNVTYVSKKGKTQRRLFLFKNGLLSVKEQKNAMNFKNVFLSSQLSSLQRIENGFALDVASARSSAGVDSHGFTGTFDAEQWTRILAGNQKHLMQRDERLRRGAAVRRGRGKRTKSFSGITRTMTPERERRSSSMTNNTSNDFNEWRKAAIESLGPGSTGSVESFEGLKRQYSSHSLMSECSSPPESPTHSLMSNFSGAVATAREGDGVPRMRERNNAKSSSLRSRLSALSAISQEVCIIWCHVYINTPFSGCVNV